MKKLAFLLGTAAVCTGLLTSPVRAETVYFTTENRTYLSDWVISSNNGCPPGSTLVKKEHLLRSDSYRCVVPREKKIVVYRPGMAIPKAVTYSTLPEVVVQKLPAAPEGKMYISSDNNIYLIDSDTRMVVDAVTVVGPAD